MAMPETTVYKNDRPILPKHERLVRKEDYHHIDCNLIRGPLVVLGLLLSLLP